MRRYRHAPRLSTTSLVSAASLKADELNHTIEPYELIKGRHSELTRPLLLAFSRTALLVEGPTSMFSLSAAGRHARYSATRFAFDDLGGEAKTVASADPFRFRHARR